MNPLLVVHTQQPLGTVRYSRTVRVHSTTVGQVQCKPAAEAIRRQNYKSIPEGAISRRLHAIRGQYNFL